MKTQLEKLKEDSLKNDLTKNLEKQKRFKILNPKKDIVPQIFYRLKNENKIRIKYINEYLPTYEDRIDYFSDFGEEIRNKYKKDIEEVLFVSEVIVHSDSEPQHDAIICVYRNINNEVLMISSEDNVLHSEEENGYKDNILIYLFEPIVRIRFGFSINNDDVNISNSIIRIPKKDLDKVA